MPKGGPGFVQGGFYSGGPYPTGGPPAPLFFVVAPPPQDSGRALVPALLQYEQREPENRLKPENPLGGG